MKNKIIEWVIFWFICGLGALGVGMTVVVYVEQSEKIEELENYVKEYESKFTEYKTTYEWMDDYIEFLDDINQEAIKDGFYYSFDGTKYQTESINNVPLDIEIMYGEMTGSEVSMDGDQNNDYVLVTVKGVEYKTFHISDETIYLGYDMVVIKIGDVYLSYVDKP